MEEKPEDRPNPHSIRILNVPQEKLQPPLSREALKQQHKETIDAMKQNDTVRDGV